MCLLHSAVSMGRAWMLYLALHMPAEQQTERQGQRARHFKERERDAYYKEGGKGRDRDACTDTEAEKETHTERGRDSGRDLDKKIARRYSSRARNRQIETKYSGVEIHSHRGLDTDSRDLLREGLVPCNWRSKSQLGL